MTASSRTRPKVFIPLTKLCRDVCHYCTFAQPPRRGERAYMTADEVLEVARAGAGAGCHEALFTLGDKPELRYRAAREELAELGCETTIEYLARMCELVLAETGLLPHVNPGVMTRDDLEPAASRLGLDGAHAGDHLRAAFREGGPHFGSPDKLPERRLETIELAGELAIPFTTGILIGIGETREERVEALEAIAACTTLRPHPGGDRPELPGQAGDEDGRRARAEPRRAPLDDPRAPARRSGPR